MITDFFISPSELKEFAPQMPTDGRIDSFEAHFRPQYQKIVAIIGHGTYDKLRDYYRDYPEGENNILKMAVEHLRGALANLTAIPYFLFEAGQRNNTDNKLYRYQENAQVETYLNNAWTELNFLLNHLERNIDFFTEFAATDQYKIRQSLFIKNAAELKRYYGAIDSAYFFNNVVFIIEEVQEDEIKSRVKTFPEITDSNLKFLIGKAITYETLGRACRQLDYTELPQGLRNDLSKEANEKNGKETEVKNALSAFFHNKAAGYFLKIEDATNKSRNAGTYIPVHSTLTKTDKFYMP